VKVIKIKLTWDQAVDALPVVGNTAPCWLVCLDCRTVVQFETDEMGDYYLCPKCETLLSEPERVCAKVAPTEDEVAEAWGLAEVGL
jgi:hypothetical protein